MAWKTTGDAFSAAETNYCWYNQVGTFGGDGSDGAYAPVGDEARSGIYNYTTMTIDAARTITVSDWAIFKCTGNVSIPGILTASTAITMSGGVGVFGSAPRSQLEDDANNWHSGGGGLGYGGSRTPDDYRRGPGYGGIREVGLEIIKQHRGWFTGASGWDDGPSGGGAILIETLGSITIAGSLLANGGAAANDAGGGAGCLGMLAVGNIDLTNGTITSNGGAGGAGAGNEPGGGGGAIVAATEGTYTGVGGGTLTVTGGAGSGGEENGQDGLTYTVGSLSTQFVQRPWACGGS